MTLIAAAGLACIVVGASITVLAVAGTAAGRTASARLRALGFLYVGLSALVAGGGVFLLSRLGDPLPLPAGVPVVGFAFLAAAAFRLAASAQFRRAREARVQEDGLA